MDWLLELGPQDIESQTPSAAIKILSGELARASGQKVQVFGPESKRYPWWHLFEAEGKIEVGGEDT